MNTAPTAKRTLRNDIIFVVIVLAVAALGACLLLLRGSGDTVRITVDGELYGVFSLSQDVREDIQTANGNHNHLVIRDGKAFVETATCPDGICAAHRPIFRNGESIVCLPHGVVITVVSENPDTDVDIVV